MRWLFTLFLAFFLPVAVMAQTAEEDRGYLQGLLEDNLSGAGRVVRIVGFAGALSSRATIEELTIADEEGIWLTARGLTLGWSRAAILAGRLDIAELSAEELLIPRAPIPAASDTPAPEAREFSLPDLPVPVNIGEVRITRAELGAALLGQEATLALTGTARLSGGDGSTELAIERAEGGTFRLAGAFSNTTRQLTLDLGLDEPQGGLAATLLGLPGAPALALTLQGDAPLDDFTARLRLTTEGVERLTGTARLAAERDATQPDLPPGWRFSADLGGDIAPVFAPAYRPFFGPDIHLAVEGRRTSAGALDLETLRLTADALTLSGRAAFSAEGWPTLLDLGARLQSSSGEAVLLPVNGEKTYVSTATLALSFDASKGEAWSLTSRIDGLSRGGLAAQSADLTANGQIAADAGRITGKVETKLAALSLSDPALATAIGPNPAARFAFDWIEGAPLAFSDILASSQGAALSGALTVTGPLEELSLTPDLSLIALDLSRFSALANTPLSGSANLAVQGAAQPLSGAFDLAFSGGTRNLALAQPRLDTLLEGDGELTLHVSRDLGGTYIRAFDIHTAHAAITAKGALKTNASALTATAEITETARVLPALQGPSRVSVTALQGENGWQLRGNGSGPGATELSLNAAFPDAPDGLRPLSVDATLTAANIAPFSQLLGQPASGGLSLTLTAEGDLTTRSGSANLALNGQSLRIGPAALAPLFGATQTLTAALKLEEGHLRIESADLATPEVTAKLSGETEGSTSRFTYETSLRDLSLLADGFPGAASAKGTASSTDGVTWQIDAMGSGPAGLTGEVKGTASAERLNLSATGRTPLALANEFIRPRLLSGTANYDLRIDGPPALSSVSGTLSTSDARLALPAERLAFGPITGAIRITNGRAELALDTLASTGGALSIRGPITLAAPFDASLLVEISGLRLSDPTLYRTRLDGTLSLKGPLAGGARISGALDLGNTEILVPNGSASAFSGLPGLKHINEPAEVRRTRSFAGLLNEASAESAPSVAYPVDIILSAPSRIFVRGRGLDAELGGQLRLQGTTADLLPQGRFELIRGRIDVLGQRFTLTSGQFRLQGDFDPWLRFVADTETSVASIRIVLEGLASSPSLSFESAPSLPEDEVLSLLIFGRETAKLSPLQAVRLGLAIRTLTGRGGEGFTGTLRKGLRLDDLDVRTTDEGTTEARIGAYLSDKLYSEVTTDSAGSSEIKLNLQIRPGLTARGRVTSEGETGVGIYFEKDY